MPQIKSLQNETKLLKDQIDEMEQYSRRTCLKFSGIPEEGTSENTDKLAMKIHQPDIIQGIIQNWIGPNRKNPSSRPAQEEWETKRYHCTVS